MILCSCTANSCSPSANMCSCATNLCSSSANITFHPAKIHFYVESTKYFRVIKRNPHSPIELWGLILVSLFSFGKREHALISLI